MMGILDHPFFLVKNQWNHPSEDPLTVDVLGVALTNKTVGFAEQCDQH
jgi:hypothetical protein